MKPYRAELHVHTVLSPCGAVEMIPPLIVQEAIDRKIDLIAITDHNASANFMAVKEAAAGTSLTVLPGMELQTQEEVHLLCLFDSYYQLEKWQQEVDRSLPDLQNNAQYFGEQYIVDSNGDFIRCEDRLLLVSSNMTLEQATNKVSSLGGLAIPAHIDRQANGLFAILGFIPEGLPIAALEITRRLSPEQALQKFPSISGYPIIQNGDVHHLDDFLGSTVYWLEQPTLQEIHQALDRINGRDYQVITSDNSQGFSGHLFIDE